MEVKHVGSHRKTRTEFSFWKIGLPSGSNNVGNYINYPTGKDAAPSDLVFRCDAV